MTKIQAQYQCRLCGSSNYKLFVQAIDRYADQEDSYDLVRCKQCGLISVFPAPDQIEIPVKSYYQDENPFLYFHASKKEFLDQLYSFFHPYSVKWRVKQVEKSIGAGRVLDIHCGNGTFLYELKQKLWDVNGIEPNTQKADFARSTLGINIFPELESVQQKFQHYFDVITCWHSFGTFANPDKTLQALKQLLHPNGRLMIALPNWKSLDFGFYGKNWSAWDVPRRIFHFSPRQVSLLLKKNGLILEKNRVIPFDIYYNCLLSERIISGRENAGKLKRFAGSLRSFFIAVTAHILSLSGTASGMLYFVRKRD